MKNYTFTSVKPHNLQAERAHYNAHVGTPLDGMWTVFVDMGAHWTIAHMRDGKPETIGYCVVNEQNKVLQFMLTQPSRSTAVFAQMVDELNVTGAYVATCEAQYLAHCLDHQKSVRVNAIMYQEGAHKLATTLSKNAKFRMVIAGELDLAVEFGVAALGCDQGWLHGYYSECVDRCELFGYWQDGTLIAAGECRPSTMPYSCADVGMVVSKAHRGRGLGTDILRRLRVECKRQGLAAICSTESGNIGAQKAIARAGFVSTNRILEIDF